MRVKKTILWSEFLCSIILYRNNIPNSYRQTQLDIRKDAIKLRETGISKISKQNKK